MTNTVETLQDVHMEKVRPWLDLIDALRADGVQQDLPLPQIAVMGDQSCGKSSVLEAISGVPFPRGTGLTTRCPIQLIMKRAHRDTPWSAHASVSWGKATQPRGAGPVASPHELTDVILQLTSAVTAGAVNGFASDSIVIKITSPDVPDLTLIDLPGIVRTATQGQTVSVVSEVNSLITRYINQERTIILAVVPANQDVATVDILERARQVDPEGERTLGVLTKPDLVDQGAEGEVLQVLTNKKAPLRLGYVMVKNRNQKEVESGMGMREAREEEEVFFAGHEAYQSVEASLLGVRQLMDRLTRLLVKRIEAALPGIKWELQNQLEGVERELIPLGKALPLTVTERQHGLMKIISEYCKIIRQAVRGDYRDPIMTVNPKLRIYGETHALFATMQESIARTGEIFSDPNFATKVLAQMSVMKGREFPGFLNSQIFYGFMVQNVETWRPSVEVCRVQLVACLRGICTEVISAVAPHLPRLRQSVSTIVAGVVERYGEELMNRLEDLFAKESDPYTSNEYMLVVMNQIRCQKFGDAVDAALKASGPKPESIDSLKNDVKKRLGDWYMRHHGVNPASTVADMCVLLKAYWQVATKRLVDNVCMTCEKDFIEKVIVEIESSCFTIGSSFDGGPTLAELFEEDKGILAKRLELIAKRERLTKALSTLRNMAPDCVAVQAVSAD